MNQFIELSLEQQFSLRCFSEKVQHMSHEQAQEFLLMLYTQMMIRETIYQRFIKQEWGLDSEVVSE